MAHRRLVVACAVAGVLSRSSYHRLEATDSCGRARSDGRTQLDWGASGRVARPDAAPKTVMIALDFVLGCVLVTAGLAASALKLDNVRRLIKGLGAVCGLSGALLMAAALHDS